MHGNKPRPKITLLTFWSDVVVRVTVSCRPFTIVVVVETLLLAPIGKELDEEDDCKEEKGSNGLPPKPPILLLMPPPPKKGLSKGLSKKLSKGLENIKWPALVHSLAGAKPIYVPHN